MGFDGLMKKGPDEEWILPDGLKPEDSSSSSSSTSDSRDSRNIDSSRFKRPLQGATTEKVLEFLDECDSDSIRYYSSGSDIHVVYKNEQIYPKYMIRYRVDKFRQLRY